jgi:TatD DNase family protein
MELVDTHCHPHFADFGAGSDNVLKDADAAGVTRLIVVGTTIQDSRAAIDFAAEHKNVWAAAGVHPHAAREFLVTDDSALQIRSMLAQPKVVAIGEIGLDFYKNYSTKEEQEAVLRAQIEEGLSSRLPFIFHVRDAWDMFWQTLDDYQGISGVVHSFSAHERQLEQVLERGLYVGLNGIMTFTKDEKQLGAAKKVPLERLLLETDAPFLAPKPFRGQRCEPKHVKIVGEFLSDLRGEPLEKLAAQTTKNAVELFKAKR